MTDAWATIIASIITSVVTGLVTLIGILSSKSLHTHQPHRKTYPVFVYVVMGLCIGAIIGVIIGIFLLAKPHPAARIIEPTDGQYVPIYAKVTMEYKNIPSDRHVWLAVRIPGIGLAPWLIYPQLRGMQAIQKSYGVYEITAAFGGDNDSERPFNIVVLLVDEDAEIRFVEYANKCNLDSNLCNGMILPDKGVEILDFETVIRK